MATNEQPKEVLDFLNFVNASPSAFHAVESARTRLEAAGFQKIRECDSWSGKLVREGKYYFTRNRSTIVAFAIGGKYKRGNGITMIGAHTDSPCLKIKPVSNKSKAGYLQVGVQTYGGGIWHTWFDRDLSVAGRVMVERSNGQYEYELVNVRRPILRIPTLAIHLDAEVNPFKFNNEEHLTPMLATVTKGLTGQRNDEGGKSDAVFKHQPILLDVLAQELKVGVAQIKDFELALYDTQESVIGGACGEFIFSARLDNLIMSYAALAALINSCGSLAEGTTIQLISLFDNEEIGSTSAYGANSSLLEYTLRRLASDACNTEKVSDTIFEEIIHKSFMISADMSHAVHPNYSEKHEKNHRPQMHKGAVLKFNANQRYATTAVTAFVIREAARIADVPLQEFAIRADTRCGSTIGPMVSANLGLRIVDIGNPQLSMHSIREVAGTDDIANATRLFEAYLEHFADIDSRITVD